MTVDQFPTKTAQFMRVIWDRRRAVFAVEAIDGKRLFETQKARLAVHVAIDFEGDYAEKVSA